MDDQATREAAADLIDGAIDVLHDKGWCQNTMRDQEGRVCIEGALLTAAATAAVLAKGPYLARGALSDARRAVGTAVGTDPATFNDYVATTIEDVTLTLKLTSHSLREVA